MPVNQKNSYLNFILFALLLSFIIFFGACADGADDVAEDTTNETTCALTYDAPVLPSPTSWTDPGYDISAVQNTTLSGSSTTISSAGVYNITGTLSNGQIVVDTEDEGIVRLILNGVNISCSSSAPIYVVNAGTVIIDLADGSGNTVTDARAYSAEALEPDAAIFSASDLVITGTGSLSVVGNYSDGIKGKDGLIIDSGVINVESEDDGIIGRDYVSMEDGTITIDAGGDGLKSTYECDADKGYVYIQGGAVDITAGADGIQGAMHILASGGDITVDAASKGIVGNIGVTLYNGIFNIDTTTGIDDAIHSNDTIVIHDGTFFIAAADDAIHAELALTIEDGNINVSECFEGIESKVITINDGYIRVYSTDDPINASDGSMAGGGIPMEAMQGGGGGPPPGGGMEMQADVYLYINGGYIALYNMEGTTDSDGFDSNGSIVMTGGIVIINGGIGANGIMDYGSFTMDGGFIIGAGTSNMPQAAGTATTSSQKSFFVTLNVTAGTLFHVERSDGESIVTFAPSGYIPVQAIEFSSPLLDPDETEYTYYVYTGGTYSPDTDYDGLYGTTTDNVYEDTGTYTPGTLIVSGPLSDFVPTGGGGPPPM